ncbi:methyl-accepting chemotaxis protein [bacterium 1xD8-6]|nr:methyl-accepting chemotaxis protein [bacterium D16-36]RKI67261.1 methyl-accepting chemotaxis protein [bacterium 1xD8-6]
MGKTSRGSNKEKKGVHFSLMTKIIMISICPLLILTIVLSVVGVNSIKEGMRQEIISELETLTICVEGTLNTLNEGDFSLDEQGHMFKGNYDLTARESLLDSLVKDTDNDCTLFYDKTRRATTLINKETNERMLGSDASEEVYETVVKKGGVVEAYDLEINGENYYAYYRPLKGRSGQVVGMYFAGCPSAGVNGFINRQAALLIVSALVVSAAALVIIMISALAIRKGIRLTNHAVIGLADGDLNVNIAGLVLKRSDELGDMARGVQTLREELRQVMSKVKESSEVLNNAGRELSSMASQTSNTADDIGHAVEDISKGAVSQAEEIEMASSRINEMGGIIERIVDSVGTLDVTAGNMKMAGDRSVSIINDLSHSNDRTMSAIERIGRQVNATNESANKISEAIEIITNIAEETNLLSLNASIEAARAGEQGKGFAVVANQIQKLAEQSNESAQRIAEIIKELLQDSENTVAVMNEVQEIVDEQQEKLRETQSQFNDVSRGIDSSTDETSGIKDQTTHCDSARNKVVDVITNLSAISEQNAASTQETTASMQELNATINLLAESAGNLTKLSEDLEERISFFHF